MLFDRGLVDASDFGAQTGWRAQPEGLCRNDVCVALPESAWRGEQLDLTVVAQALQMPLVADPELGLWALGPPAAEHVLQSARAPDLVLPDSHGQPFDLASLRGTKVLLVAWASW